MSSTFLELRSSLYSLANSMWNGPQPARSWPALRTRQDTDRRTAAAWVILADYLLGIPLNANNCVAQALKSFGAVKNNGRSHKHSGCVIA